jgi:hypothetical protein
MQPQSPTTLRINNESVKAAIAGKRRDAILQNMRLKGIPSHHE